MKAVNVDDVLKIIYKYGAFIFVTDSKKYSDMENEIANLPELKQKTGKWIYDSGCEGDDGAWHHIYTCSECGRLVSIDSQQYTHLTEKYPYCHCGAKMEGVSE